MNAILRQIAILALGLCSIPFANGQIARVTEIQKVDNSLVMRYGPSSLRLEVFSPRIIRVTFTDHPAFPESRNLGVIGKPVPTHWVWSSSPSEVDLKTEAVLVRVDRKKAKVTFFDRNGNRILAEKRGGMAPIVVGPTRAEETRQAFSLQTGEAIYGFGQHQDGYVNRRGEIVPLQQMSGEVAVPFMLSSKGYGLLWDNPAITEINVAVEQEETVPVANLYDEDGEQGGLTGRYYEGHGFQRLVSTRRDKQIWFDWSRGLPPGVPPKHFSVRWTGSIVPERTGEYSFLGYAEDGMRMYLDGKLVFSDWRSRPLGLTIGRMKLQAGHRYFMKVEYFHDLGTPRVRLNWHQPVDDPAMVWTSLVADAIDYYFLFGPDLDKVISSYRDLTGPAPMLPRYAYGLWQGKDRYKSQEELLQVAGRYRAEHIPVDGLIQDWKYWEPNPWGSHLFDETRYPNPTKMMRDLHDENVHLIASTTSMFDADSPNALALDKVGGLYPQKIQYGSPGPFRQWLDPFNSEARRVYWSQLSTNLLQKGIDGYVLDGNEPALSGNWGEYLGYTTAAGKAALVYNAYPLLQTQGVFEGQRAEKPEARVLMLSRSAYTGQQRTGAVTWSGSTDASWDALAHQVGGGIDYSLSGLPYWTSLTGGTASVYATDPRYEELFTRWFQFSVFCPMLVVTGLETDKELYQFDAATRSNLIDFDRFRYRMLPYIYSNAWAVSSKGASLIRGLILDFRSDPYVYDTNDQYMFGRSIMVCPIVKPNATSRQVYLPAGETWIDFWTGKPLKGKTRVTAYAPLSRLPLYVRSGSIIPFGPDVENCANTGGPIELRVYTGNDASFELYEDEGDGYAYEKGVYATLPISWNEKTKTLRIGAVKGSYPGMPSKRSFRVVFVKPGHGVGSGLSSSADVEIAYEGKATSAVMK